MIKGTRRFKSWQCGHLSSSNPLDFFMLARGIDNLAVALRETEELMNTRSADCKGICICNHVPSDKSEALRKKNIELAETVFEKRDEDRTAEYLKILGIDYILLPDSIMQDIAYTDHLEQISQSTGNTFFISGVIIRNRLKDSVSFTVRRTEGRE